MTGNGLLNSEFGAYETIYVLQVLYECPEIQYNIVHVKVKEHLIITRHKYQENHNLRRCFNFFLVLTNFTVDLMSDTSSLEFISLSILQ